MLVLALDTTGVVGSLALLDGGVVLEEIALEGPDGFGHILFPAIADLLARHGRGLADVGLFAGAAGPGSFTGVRVGLTAVKGLAEACGVPAAGVSNLRALAALGEDLVRAPWIDARRGEIYGGLYDAAGVALAAEVVMPLEEWRRALPDGAVEVELDGRLLAAAVGRLALADLLAGAAGDAALVDANYVRRSDAELLFKVPE